MKRQPSSKEFTKRQEPSSKEFTKRQPSSSEFTKRQPSSREFTTGPSSREFKMKLLGIESSSSSSKSKKGKPKSSSNSLGQFFDSEPKKVRLGGSASVAGDRLSRRLNSLENKRRSGSTSVAGDKISQKNKSDNRKENDKRDDQKYRKKSSIKPDEPKSSSSRDGESEVGTSSRGSRHHIKTKSGSREGQNSSRSKEKKERRPKESRAKNVVEGRRHKGKSGLSSSQRSSAVDEMSNLSPGRRTYTRSISSQSDFLQQYKQVEQAPVDAEESPSTQKKRGLGKLAGILRRK
jgi:hypothetical protein